MKPLCRFTVREMAYLLERFGDQLKERELFAIMANFGIGCESMTLVDIGQHLPNVHAGRPVSGYPGVVHKSYISRERVRNIRDRGIRKLEWWGRRAGHIDPMPKSRCRTVIEWPEWKR